MSKHSRDEDLEDIPLQNSIKKMKLDSGEQYRSYIAVTLNMNDTFQNKPESQEAENSYEVELRRMNQLLGSLHSLRVGRRAQHTNIAEVQSHTIAGPSHQQNNNTDSQMDDSMDISQDGNS